MIARLLILTGSLLFATPFVEAQTGTFVVRKPQVIEEQPPSGEPTSASLWTEEQYFRTRKRPHTLAVFGSYNREGYTLLNNFGARYGFFVTPSVAMGIDYEEKYYRDIYRGNTIGPYLRYEWSLVINRKFSLTPFWQLGYQIGLLRPNPEANSSLGFREVNLATGFRIPIHEDRFSLDLNGSWIWATSETQYQRYSKFTPTIRFNAHF